MADPPAGAPEATPTNTQATTDFSVENFQPNYSGPSTMGRNKKSWRGEGVDEFNVGPILHPSQISNL